jgi:hypothetical protein
VAVDVLIRLEHRDPPVGTVLIVRDVQGQTSTAVPAVRFTGWLGLLRVLSDVVGKPGK